ncbi:MAG: DUF1588 domain-containing protein [Myxococcales bacterium]
MMRNAFGLLLLGAAAVACSGRYYEVGGIDGAAGNLGTTGGSASGGNATSTAGRAVTTDPGVDAGAGAGDPGTSSPALCVPRGAPAAVTGAFAEPGVVWMRIATLTYGEPWPATVGVHLPEETTPGWAGQQVTAALQLSKTLQGSVPGVELFLRQALELDADATFSEPWGVVATTNNNLLNALLLAPLEESGRVGVFTEPSWLETKTTISSRGAAISRVLFATPVPPPPANFQNPALDPTLQDRMALQTQLNSPVCAGCHQLMDPLGFVLGHFAADGSYRELDHGLAIDTTGSRRSGMAPDELIEFDGIVDFGRKFAGDCDALKGIAATFALAAGPLEGAPPELVESSIERIQQAFVNSNRSYEDLVKAYIQSPAGLRP